MHMNTQQQQHSPTGNTVLAHRQEGAGEAAAVVTLANVGGRRRQWAAAVWLLSFVSQSEPGINGETQIEKKNRCKQMIETNKVLRFMIIKSNVLFSAIIILL